jgi:glucan phosphoethanolaminetransferase (alkaline phosphatase superfamily)
VSRSAAVRVLAFYVALLAVFAWIGNGPSAVMSLVNRLYVYHGIPKTAFFVIAYLGATAGLLALYLSRSRVLRCSSHLVSFLSIALFLSYRQVNGYGYTFYDAKMAVSVYGWRYSGEAVQTFLPHLLWPCAVALCFVLAVEALHRTVLPKVSPWWGVLPVLALVPVYAVNVRTLGEISQFPAPYEVPVLSYVAKYRDLPLGMRDEPYLKPVSAPMARHVIYIVDESIRGDMLSVNGYRVDTTPFLKGAAGRMVNLGVAAASTNCSSTTHIVLEAGIRLDQLPDREYRTLRQPSLFQYAQGAGYRTFVLDGPNSWGRPYEWMSGHDLEAIDSYRYVRKENPGIRSHDIDYRLVDIIDTITRTEGSSFIFVVKYGCHFSYENDYPPERRVFSPTIGGSREPTLDAVLNSYYNAIHWSVDGFFRKLLPLLEDRSAIVVYTSDHGQSIEEYRTLPATHCVGQDPPGTQASVPLILFPMGAEAQRALGRHGPVLTRNRDRASHFELFPTVLQVMGYDPSEVKRLYGSSLFDELGGRREFVSGTLYGRGFFQKHAFEGQGR